MNMAYRVCNFGAQIELENANVKVTLEHLTSSKIPAVVTVVGHGLLRRVATRSGLSLTVMIKCDLPVCDSMGTQEKTIQ